LKLLKQKINSFKVKELISNKLIYEPVFMETITLNSKSHLNKKIYIKKSIEMKMNKLIPLNRDKNTNTLVRMET
jgi:hypothetical protein